MNKENETPSSRSTRWELLCFLWNTQHRIPANHHKNLVLLRGCKLSNFKSYLKNGHKLSEDAIRFMIESPDCLDTLLVWLQYYRDSYSIQKFSEKIVSRIGAEAFLEYKYNLSQTDTHKLLVGNKVDIILKFMNQMLFCDSDKKLLLELHNLDLTLHFLKSRPALSEAAEALLAYDETEVFELYFSFGNLASLRRGIIEKKSVEIFKIMLLAQQEFTLDDFKLLIDLNDIEKLKCFCKYRSLNAAQAQYVCDHASEEAFHLFIKAGLFPYNFGGEYARLIKPENRHLLLDYLERYSLPTAEAEIQLIKSGDDELINIYHHSFKNKTKAFILVNGLDKKFGISIADISSRCWETEALIFTSENDELIKQYLFIGEAHSKGLTEFGEAMLFQHGSLEILDAYMDEEEPDELAQHAIISRWNTELISLFLDKHNFTFSNTVVAEFLKKADTEMALKYLQNINDLSHFLNDECPKAATYLCEKNDKEIYQFLLDNQIYLDEHSCVLFVRCAPPELVAQYFDKFQLETDAEAELFKRKDKKLLQLYLQEYNLDDENLTLLFNLLDVDLIKLYGVDTIKKQFTYSLY